MDTMLIDNLIDILNEETEMYKSILELSKNKTGAIVGGKVNELESITGMEQSLILRLSRMEEKREQLVSEMERTYNLKASDITLKNLGEVFPGEQAEKLKKCYELLPGIVRELDETNTLNTKLLQNSLEYIDFSINVLSNAGFADSTYEGSGLSKESGKQNLIDMRL